MDKEIRLIICPHCERHDKFKMKVISEKESEQGRYFIHCKNCDRTIWVHDINTGKYYDIIGYSSIN